MRPIKLLCLVVWLVGCDGQPVLPPIDLAHPVDMEAQCSLFGAPCLTVANCCQGSIPAKCLANACSPDIPVTVVRKTPHP